MFWRTERNLRKISKEKNFLITNPIAPTSSLQFHEKGTFSKNGGLSNVMCESSHFASLLISLLTLWMVVICHIRNLILQTFCALYCVVVSFFSLFFFALLLLYPSTVCVCVWVRRESHYQAHLKDKRSCTMWKRENYQLILLLLLSFSHFFMLLNDCVNEEKIFYSIFSIQAWLLAPTLSCSLFCRSLFYDRN